MRESRFRLHIWASVVGMRDQLKRLSMVYLKHGHKANRQYDIQILTEACVWIARKHRLHNVRQIEPDHMVKFWQAHRQLGDHELCCYWRGFCAFYEIMERSGEPPRPRTSQPLDEILLRETVTRRFPAGLN